MKTAVGRNLLFAASLRLVFRSPAFLFCAYAITLHQDEYYRSTYTIVTLIFNRASLLLGQIQPAWLHAGRFEYPWLWLFIAVSLAWRIALLSLALLNVTPLSIGKNNGDGTDTFSSCLLSSILAALVHSPVELVFLTH